MPSKFWWKFYSARIVHPAKPQAGGRNKHIVRRIRVSKSWLLCSLSQKSPGAHVSPKWGGKLKKRSVGFRKRDFPTGKGEDPPDDGGQSLEDCRTEALGTWRAAPSSTEGSGKGTWPNMCGKSHWVGLHFVGEYGKNSWLATTNSWKNKQLYKKEKCNPSTLCGSDVDNIHWKHNNVILNIDLGERLYS